MNCMADIEAPGFQIYQYNHAAVNIGIYQLRVFLNSKLSTLRQNFYFIFVSNYIKLKCDFIKKLRNPDFRFTVKAQECFENAVKIYVLNQNSV